MDVIPPAKRARLSSTEFTSTPLYPSPSSSDGESSLSLSALTTPNSAATATAGGDREEEFLDVPLPSGRFNAVRSPSLPPRSLSRAKPPAPSSMNNTDQTLKNGKRSRSPSAHRGAASNAAAASTGGDSSRSSNSSGSGSGSGHHTTGLSQDLSRMLPPTAGGGGGGGSAPSNGNANCVLAGTAANGHHSNNSNSGSSGAVGGGDSAGTSATASPSSMFMSPNAGKGPSSAVTDHLGDEFPDHAPALFSQKSIPTPIASHRRFQNDIGVSFMQQGSDPELENLLKRGANSIEFLDQDPQQGDTMSPPNEGAASSSSAAAAAANALPASVPMGMLQKQKSVSFMDSAEIIDFNNSTPLPGTGPPPPGFGGFPGRPAFGGSPPVVSPESADPNIIPLGAASQQQLLHARTMSALAGVGPAGAIHHQHTVPFASGGVGSFDPRNGVIGGPPSTAAGSVAAAPIGGPHASHQSYSTSHAEIPLNYNPAAYVQVPATLPSQQQQQYASYASALGRSSQAVGGPTAAAVAAAAAAHHRQQQQQVQQQQQAVAAAVLNQQHQQRVAAAAAAQQAAVAAAAAAAHHQQQQLPMSKSSPPQGLPDPRLLQQQAAQQQAAAAAAAKKKAAAKRKQQKHGAKRPYPPEKPELGDKYEYVRFLGRGSYGDVSEAKVVATGRHVAVKHIFNIFENTIEAKRILREIRILRLLQHKHVVTLVDILPPDDLENFQALDIIFEFVDTDLAKLIQTKQYFIELHVKYMLFQILCGLKYLHSCNIVHRDAKPANILVNEDCSIKICDFGLARSLAENSHRHLTPHGDALSPHLAAGGRASPVPPGSPYSAAYGGAAAGGFIPSLRQGGGGGVGAIGGHPNFNDITNGMVPPKPSIGRQLTKHVVTRWYRAPEIILRNDYSTQVDLWSAGCILGELLSMQKENCPRYSDRAPMFPGTSSNMSKSPKHAMRDSQRKDQLNVIFDVIGTPTDSEKRRMSSSVTKEINLYEPRSKIDYHERFPGASSEALDLLDKLLQFDPQKRLTAEQALAHPFLQQVRAGLRDSEMVAPPTDGLTFEFEDVQLTEEQIRELIVREVEFYNPNMRLG